MENTRFRFKHGNIRLLGLALSLMLLGSLIILLSPRPLHYAPREPRPQAHSVPFNVSLDDSEWIIPIDNLTYGPPTRIGITDLETNGTTVGIAIQNRSNETVYAISGVSQIANSSLVVPASEGFRIIATREIGDANGSLMILIWLPLPPMPDFETIIASYVYSSSFLLILSIIVFWKIVTTKTSRRSIRPAWVAILVIIGLILVVPYVNGSLGGYFTPTNVTEQVYFDRKTLVLNETDPVSLFSFGIEVPITAESFRIHSFDDDNKRYHFELIGANGEVLLSATHENSSIVWEIIGESVSHEHSLKLDRVDIDVDVSLSIEASATTIIIPVDPLQDSILVVIGFIALTLAIATSLAVQTVEKVGQNW